jgi:hypothetical protein
VAARVVARVGVMVVAMVAEARVGAMVVARVVATAEVRAEVRVEEARDCGNVAHLVCAIATVQHVRGHQHQAARAHLKQLATAFACADQVSCADQEGRLHVRHSNYQTGALGDRVFGHGSRFIQPATLLVEHQVHSVERLQVGRRHVEEADDMRDAV